MPGITKRKQIGEQMRFNKQLKRPLYLISQILPINYDAKILLNYFQRYYPTEWDTLVQMQEQYKKKDDFLKKVGKKVRYKPLSPTDYFYSLQVVKNILHPNRKKNYAENFNLQAIESKRLEFENKRKMVISKRANRIKENTHLIQNIDPLYVDYYISIYHKKGITTEQKIEIVSDLSKYNSNKINTFLYTLNDAERNNQVRKMAFDLLQKRGLYVKLRKNFKGNKKVYQIEKSKFDVTPEDLFKRLQNNSFQAKKKFDVFISHSYSNKCEMIKLYKHLNNLGFSCYCDWSADSDFLQRSMCNDGIYTEEVLKWRIRQSQNILYVNCPKAQDSNWVKTELAFARKLNKNIVEIGIADITNSLVSIDFSNITKEV